MHDETPNDGADVPSSSRDVSDAAMVASLRLVAHFAADAIVVHQEGRIVYANALAAALAKVSSEDAMIGASIMDFVPPDGAAALFERLTGIGPELGATSEPTLTTMRDTSGGEVPVRSATVRTEWNGGPAFQTMFRVESIGLFGSAIRLHRPSFPDPMMARLESVLPSLQQAVIVISADGIIELANPVAVALLSLPAELIPGIRAESLAIAFPGGESPIDECLRSGASATDRRATVVGPVGERTLLCSCRRLDAAPHSPLIVTLVDVTLHGGAIGAERDALTGLTNRTGVVAAIDALVGALDGAAASVLICVMDVRDLATVNDVVGHDAGDQVLRTIGARIAAVAPAGSIVGRTDGDQFAVVTRMSGAAAEISGLVDRLHTVVVQPITYGLRSHRVTVGVGFTTASVDDARTAPNLLRDAEVALRYAKRSPRLPFVEFEADQRDQLHRRQHIEHDLRDTLLKHPDRLYVVYQPIVRLGDRRVVAVEALIRWEHPILGVIGPDEFIPIAEESDLIELIGAFVQRTAGREFAARPWTAQMILTVNASRRELTDWNYPSRLRTTLRDVGLPPARLCIEASESMIADGGDVVPIIAELRSTGALVALDDFGTGASSLSQLNDLPLDFIKTAKGFTDALDGRDGPQAVLAAIAAIGVANGLRVVVEGVETAVQAAAVAKSGVALAQGFHFARPMSLDDLERLIDIDAPVDPADPLGGRPLRP